MEDVDNSSVITDEAKPKKQLFGSARRCHEFAKRLYDEDKKNKSPIRTQIMAAQNGKPPWKLGSCSRDQTNINWGEMEELLERRMLPYIERLNQEPNKISIQVNVGDPNVADDYSRRISALASRAYRRWRGHYREELNIVGDMGRFGYGVCIWPDDIRAEFEYAPQWNVFFEQDAKPDVDCLDIVVVKSSIKTSELIDYLDNNKSEEAGWNRDAIKKMLIDGRRDKEGSDKSDSWEEYEKLLRSNYMDEGLCASRFDVFYVMYKDVESGKITMCIIPINASYMQQKEPSSDDMCGYIRYKEGAYDKMCNFIGILAQTNGEDNVHSIRGDGHKIYPKALISSRTKSRAIDDYNFTTTRWFYTNGNDATMRGSMNVHGNMGFLPTETRFVEMPKLSHLPEHNAIMGMVDGELAKSISGAQPSLYSSNAGREPSATRTRLEELKNSSLTSAEVGTFEYYLDAIYTEFVRRLTKKGRKGELAKWFQEQLKEEGIDEEIWKFENLEVFATRTIGSGSKFVQQEAAAKLVALGPTNLGEEGHHEAVEFYVQAHAGHEHTRKFIKPFNMTGKKSDHNWSANQETLAMRSGGGVIQPGGSQNDFIHIQQHLEDIQPELQAYSSGEILQSPPALEGFLVLLTQLVPHLQGHLQRLASDQFRKNEAKQAARAIADLERMRAELERRVKEITQLQQRAQEQAARIQQQAGQQQNPEEKQQAEAAKAMQDISQNERLFQQQQRQKEENFSRIQREREDSHIQKLNMKREQ